MNLVGMGGTPREKAGILPVIIYPEPPPTCSVTLPSVKLIVSSHHKIIFKDFHQRKIPLDKVK